MNSTLIVACQSMQSLAFGGIALFLPLIRKDIGLSFAQGGALAAVGTLTYALMQIPSGYLADRFDPRRLFTVGLLGVNLLSLAFALLHSYEQLLVNQALSGIFRSLVFAPGMLLISRLFPPDRKATAMGLYVAGGFSSNIVLSALGPVLIAPLGWRWLFVLFSVSALVILGVFAAVGAPAPQTFDGSPPRLADLGRLLTNGIVCLSGFIQFVRLAVVTGVNFWLPSLIVDDKGFSLTIAGAVVAIGSAVTAPSNFLGGWISDRLGRPLLVIGLSLTVLAAMLFSLSVVDGLVPLIVVVSIASVVIQLYFGPLFAVPLKHVPSANAGLVSGFCNFCANLGGFASTFGLGVIKDWSGSFDVGLWTLASMCLAALGATFALARLTARTHSAVGTV
jgi:nitrate/nitrite transporter NarK